MNPLLIAAAAQLVSGVMQHYQQEKANGASKERLAEIARMFDSIVPPDYNIHVWDNPKLAEDIPAPQLNLEAITPELYQSVGQFVPEVAEFVKETNPQLVQATEAAETGRAAQLEALERYKQIASGGFDPELQQQLDLGSRQANRDAQSRTDSILQDFQRRGQLGSGMMLAAQQEAASNAMDRAAQDSRFAAAESYRNRLSAMDKSASLGGQIRDSEMSEEARNVGIINDFNERTSKNYQNYLQAKAEALSAAKLGNLQRDQAIADANVKLKNQSKQDERDTYNKQQELRYGAAKDNRANALDIQDRKERMRQQIYDNLMAKAAGKAGVGYKQIDQSTQSARDRNASTGGVADAISAGAIRYGSDQNKKSNETVDNGKYPTPDYSSGRLSNRMSPLDEDEYYSGRA